MHRRRCLKCDKRFTTYERPEIALPTVVKKDAARAEFVRAKLRASMLLALRTCASRRCTAALKTWTSSGS